jgi:lipopolysaccharide biosynthesis protein
MKRIAIFAHYDARGEVKPYVLFHLKALQRECEAIAFVSTAELSAGELDKVRPYCSSAVLRENAGFDFGMWQHALQSLDLSDADELVLVNSSVFGPLYSLGPIFQRMSQHDCDFWGMTDSFDICSHLQSYFLVFKRPVLSSPRFMEFFNSVLPYRDKYQTIRSYEVGLTQFLRESGFRDAALVPMGSWISSERARERLRKKRRDATLFYPMQLLRAGMPFVKAHLLRDNPGRVWLRPVLNTMRESGYDMSQVQY